MTMQVIDIGIDTRGRRLWHYVREMFPPHIRVSLNLLNFGFIYFGLQAIAGVHPLKLSWITLVGAITVQLLWFFIRVYDELKDSESDLAFARAGDARFQNRPLVTGKVRLEDIAALRWWMTGTAIALNMPLGFPTLLLGLFIALGYITLTYKWFFWPRLREHVLLVFLTHIPNVLAIEIYTVTVFVAEHGYSDLGLAALALILALWATAASFEFSYKIRVPKDETIFATYSKVLGWRTATWIVIAFLAVAMACTIAACLAAGLGPSVAIFVLVVGLWAMGGCIAFLRAPTSARAKLTRYIGAYWYASCAALIAAAFVKSGVAFSP